VIWACAFVAIKFALADFGPGELAAGRFAVADLALVAYAAAARLSPPKWRDCLGIAALGLLGITLYHLFLNFGERTTSAGEASLLVATVPLFTAMYTGLGMRRFPSPLQALGLAVGFAGVVMIAVPDGRLSLSFGAAMVLMAAAAEAAYFLLQPRYLTRYSSLTFTAFTTWSASAFFFPFAPSAFEQAGHARPATLAAVIFLGLFPTVVGYALWSYALHRLPAVQTTAGLYALPAIALLLALFLLGEHPPILSIIGGSLAIFGVALSQRRVSTRAEPGNARGAVE